MTRVFLPLAALLFSAILTGSFTTRASAATLRVPEDFDSIQRAILAAEVGDTINIAAGTYRENISITDSVVLHGAGIGKTVIVAPDRQQPIVTAYSEGTVTLSDLTLSHADAPSDVPEPNPANYGVEFLQVPVVLRNIRIENTPAMYVLTSKGNLLTVENLTIACEKPFVCISLEGTRAGTRFDRVTLPEQNWGKAITVENGSAVFSNLTLNAAQKSGISVGGPVSHVKFPNLPSEIFAKIEWSDASPDGPSPEAVQKFEKQMAEEDGPVEEQSAEEKAAIEAARQHTCKTVAARRQLMREFQASLKKAPTADATIATFAQLLPKLYAIYIDENSYPDSNLDQIVSVELRAIHDRFGVAAFSKALDLPGYDKAPLRSRIEANAGFDLLDALANFEAECWVKTNFPDLPALLASWKTATPSAAPEAFLAMLKNISAKATAETPEKAKKALTTLALAEVPRFVTQFEPRAIDQLLRSLAREASPIVTLAQVSEAIPNERKTALIQLWNNP